MGDWLPPDLGFHGYHKEKGNVLEGNFDEDDDDGSPVDENEDEDDEDGGSVGRAITGDKETGGVGRRTFVGGGGRSAILDDDSMYMGEVGVAFCVDDDGGVGVGNEP